MATQRGSAAKKTGTGPAKKKTVLAAAINPKLKFKLEGWLKIGSGNKQNFVEAWGTGKLVPPKVKMKGAIVKGAAPVVGYSWDGGAVDSGSVSFIPPGQTGWKTPKKQSATESGNVLLLTFTWPDNNGIDYTAAFIGKFS